MEAVLARHAAWRGLAQTTAPGHDPALWSAPREDITLARVSQRLRFHHFEIDLAARELRDGGRLLQLSPKIFDCIAYLLDNRERAVGRDELMAAVWGRADTADSQLGQAMLKARRALGDSGEAQHTIRTVAGFGYRWIADVHEVEGAAEMPPPAEAAAPAQPASEPDAVAAPAAVTRKRAAGAGTGSPPPPWRPSPRSCSRPLSGRGASRTGRRRRNASRPRRRRAHPTRWWCCRPASTRTRSSPGCGWA